MSRIRADRIVDRAATGAPLFPNGAVITGVATATTFKGDLTGDVTGDVTGSATGLSGNVSAAGVLTLTNTTASTNSTTGALIVSGGVGIAKSLNVGGNVTVGGTLTYEDVTNVDSVGIVTARGGLVTQKLLKEEVNVTAAKLSDNTDIYLENGCVHIFTTAESTTCTPAIKYSSGVDLKDKMSVGESVVVTLITTANASAYSANITIDGDAVTENWIGGSAPSDGGSSGVDIHTFTIIKVASSGTTDQQLTVIANHSKTS